MENKTKERKKKSKIKTEKKTAEAKINERS
jgi:hypothetical protein